MGQRVCNKAFHRLLSIGKERFQKLRASVRNGDEYCPYDARYIPKGKQPPSPARQLVFDFLHGLYEESAEVIPDGLNSNKRPRQAQHRLDGKSMFRGDIRHLPPGSISEYYQLCCAANPSTAISRKLFSSASWNQQSSAFQSLTRLRLLFSYVCGVRLSCYVSYTHEIARRIRYG